MIVQLIESLQKRLQLLKYAAITALVLVLICDGLFVSKEHAHTAMEGFPGFWSLFGAGAALLLILVSKCYGSLGITTREDYYDK